MLNYRIYFISSNESNIPKQEYYTETPGFNDFKKDYEKQIKYDGKDFVISINSFNIIKEDLIKNKETDTYDLKVNLKVPGFFSYYIYNKILSFVEIKNHFIYGFTLDNLSGYIFDTKPPKSIFLSKKDQLGLYIELLNKAYSEPGDILSNNFCEDSIKSVIKNQKFELDIYLKFLQYYKNTKNIINILDSFEIKNCEIPINFEADKYESLLEKIKSNQEMYTKYCFEDGQDIKIKKKFFTLLLYFRFNKKDKDKDKAKLKNLINEKGLWEIFAEIINNNEKLYPIVEIAEEGLIKEIMSQKKISFDCVKKIIALLNPVEKLLSFIDNYYYLIFKNYRKECSMKRENSDANILAKKEKITKERMTTQEELLYYLEKQENEHHISHKKYQIILFNKRYWYLYFKNKEIGLFMINKSIYICLKNDKKFEAFKKKEKEKLKQLNNEQFLQYLSHDINEYEKIDYGIYIYPENKQYEFLRKKSDFENNIKSYMPLKIFDRIELKTFGKKDLNKWNKIKAAVFELKDIRYDLEVYNIIRNIKNLDEFDKFLNIIYSDKDYNYEISYEKKLISDLGGQFLSLISKNKFHEYFTRIASNLIYKYDQLNLKPEILICDLEKNINEDKINKIYEYLTNHYYLTSDKLINHMADYIFDKNHITIIKNLKNIKEKIIPLIFNKIDNSIKEEMLYDNLPINKYFK